MIATSWSRHKMAWHHVDISRFAPSQSAIVDSCRESLCSRNCKQFRDLMGTMQREKAEIGVLVCMDMPTEAMRDEMTAAGKYAQPTIGREYDRLQVVMIAEMLPDPQNGRPARRLDLPWARTDTVKKAAAKGDADKQQTLL
jgi:hypothetical protein